MDILFALDDLRDNTDALVGDTAPFVFRGGHWSLDTDPVGELLFKKFIKVVIEELYKYSRQPSSFIEFC